MYSKEKEGPRINRNECEPQCGCSIPTETIPRTKAFVKRDSIYQTQKESKVISRSGTSDQPSSRRTTG